MMAYEITLHSAQAEILHALLMNKNATFAVLQKTTGLTSDHFTFHLRRLVDEGYVVHQASAYTLSPKGKEFANRMDTDNKTIERQPKVAVVLIIENDKGQFVAQQRLKQPYYGFWGRPTGKMRWGEEILQTAQRELLEETNLQADLEFKGLYHKMDHQAETGELLEDKIFMLIYGKNSTGILSELFDGGRNAWMTLQELTSQERVFDDVAELTAKVKSPGIHFYEKKYFYRRAEY